MDTFGAIQTAILLAYGQGPPKHPTAKMMGVCSAVAKELATAGYTPEETTRLIGLVRARDPHAPPYALPGSVWLLAPSPEPAADWEPLPGQMRGPNAPLTPVLDLPDGTRGFKYTVAGQTVYRRLPAPTGPPLVYEPRVYDASMIEEHYAELAVQQRDGYGPNVEPERVRELLGEIAVTLGRKLRVPPTADELEEKRRQALAGLAALAEASA